MGMKMVGIIIERGSIELKKRAFFNYCSFIFFENNYYGNFEMCMNGF